MLPLSTLQAVKSLLLSDRITYKGNEIPALENILNAFAIEEMEHTRLARVRANPTQPIPETETEPLVVEPPETGK
jgi:hypothetical protein